MEKMKRLNKTGKVIIINAMCTLLSVLVFLFSATIITGSLNGGSVVTGNPGGLEDSFILSNGGILDLIGGKDNGDSNVFVNLTDGAMAYQHIIAEYERMNTNGYRIGGIGQTDTITKSPIGDVSVTQIEYDDIIIDKNGNVSGQKGFAGKDNIGIAKENEVNNLKSFCYNKDKYIERDLGSSFTYSENDGKGQFTGDFSKAKIRETTVLAEIARKGYVEAPNMFELNNESATVEEFKINSIREYVSGYKLKLKLNDKALAKFKIMIKDNAGALAEPIYESLYLTFSINRNGTIRNIFREEKYTLTKDTIIGVVKPMITGSKSYGIVYNNQNVEVSVA